MRNFQLQPKLRIMSDEITDGIDELGVLLMGHGLNAWWTGSQLDIHETRQLVRGQNATTLQVAASVIGGAGVDDQEPGRRASSCPTSCPTRRFSTSRAPYLGPCPSVQTDWTPLAEPLALCSPSGARRP